MINGENPYRRKLLTYAKNLVGSITRDQDFLDYVVPLLSLKGKQALHAVLSAAPEGPESQTTMRDTNCALAESVKKSISSIDVGCMGIDAKLRQLLKQEIKAIKGPTLTPGLKTVKRMFPLDGDDLEVLWVMVAYHCNNALARLMDRCDVTDRLTTMSIITGLSVHKLMVCTGPLGKLAQCGIIEPLSITDPIRYIQLNDNIVSCVLGINASPLVHTLCQQVKGHTYPSESFDLPDHGLKIVQTLLRVAEPCCILFYGEPGTGKTEFAKSLIASCGKRAMFIQSGLDGENGERRMALIAATNSLSPKEAVVVVDEADGLLNTGYAFLGLGGKDALRKSWLNTFLDTCQAQIVWITNDIDFIEMSTRRRFTYAIAFKSHTVQHRRAVWARHVSENPLGGELTPECVSTLAKEYRVNASIIGQALDVLRRMASGSRPDRKEAMAMLREVLSSHEMLSGKQHIAGKLKGLPAAYDPDAVNANVPPNTLTDALQAFTSRSLDSDHFAVNLLFWGNPGTGKTAYAQFLAQSLDLELIVKRASDLLSMWVGGTEKNIRNAFEEAKREKAVLLLDEADSFFIDRRSSEHSWETSQTNELLTQMENHQCILICCTNLLDNLDPAVMRRFGWKVHFRPLTTEGRVRLFHKYFPNAAGTFPSETLHLRLARVPGLTPGDISSVSRRFRLTSGGIPDTKTLLNALEEEVSYRKHGNQVTGFSPANL